MAGKKKVELNIFYKKFWIPFSKNSLTTIIFLSMAVFTNLILLSK